MGRFVVCLLFIIASSLFNPLAAQTEGGNGFWLWTFLGRLHPMIVHFPIGLLIIAFVLELIASKKKTTKYLPSIKILVAAGALSSLISVAFGFMLANSGDYSGDLLTYHQWSGIATTILALLSWFAYSKFSVPMQKLLSGITVIAVILVGHFGASMTHGENFLTEALPGQTPEQPEGKSAFILTKNSGDLSEADKLELNLQVRTIIAHNCTSCHGEAKSKGDLRLNSKEAVFTGGENGKIIVPGDPQNSEMLRRIKLPRGHKEAMPGKGKGLTKEEIEIIEYWIKKGAPWPDGDLKSIYRVAEMAPRNPEMPAAVQGLESPIDLYVDQYFGKHNINWHRRVEDHIFIRRVYLDIIGLIPTPDSVEVFIRNPNPGKREVLVNNLLNRNNDYAQHWLTFWNDALRNDYTGPGYITGGRFDITKWLYNSLRDNKPYNVFVKELISPDKESKGFIKGITWRGTINSSQTTSMQAAQNVSQVFLGLNLKCASCHDSFISDWKLEDSYAFANIFSDSALEINRCDKPTGKKAGTRILFKELGQIDTNVVTAEKMKQLAEYLTQPKDGRLYRTLVNRIWAQLMGRGIVEPVDEMDKEPWSQDLLDWLASDFVANGYDIKKLIYKIVTSKTYQLPSVGMKDYESIVSSEYVFTGMLRRRLTAEQFTDAVGKSLEPLYGDSVIVYNLLPKDLKGQLAFPRAVLVKNDPYLTALGRPNRETVSTSRVSQASLLQALELTNGDRFNNALKTAAVKWKERYPDKNEMIVAVYRNTLGRGPTESEQELAGKLLGDSPNEATVQDFLWAMTLHPEFQLVF
ncbi:DUF1549 domain-containing protein [Pollutibacter soli]|uniref:DUF1549 domain-containing protein n=1 Tax=Pollutibacter soli TaxID=3034157 RepID=UPI0030139270